MSKTQWHRPAGHRVSQTSPGFLPQPERANPSKPTGPNLPIISGIGPQCDKQTQQAYCPYYQLLTAILAPFFEKFGCGAKRTRNVTNSDFNGNALRLLRRATCR